MTGVRVRRQPAPAPQATQRLGPVLQAARDALVVLDEERRLLEANAAARELLGPGHERLLGQPLDAANIVRADGSRLRLELAASERLGGARLLWLIRDADNAAAAPPAAWADGCGGWEWEPASGALHWSEHALAVLGAAPGTTGIAALEHVHRDDRAVLIAALEATHATPRGLCHECRILHPDGSFRVVETRAEPALEASGQPLRLIGTVLDITDRRHAQIERRNLATVLDASDDAITTCSLDGVFLTWNRGAEKMYGYDAEEAIGQRLDLIIPPGERAKDHDSWERLLNDEPVRSLETLRLTKDGRTIVVSVTRSLIVDATRGVVGVASVGRDITQQKRAQELLAAAHAQAVAASAMKTQFLANMSHEIRTPMNGVIGMNELLLETELTAEQRGYAEQVARSGEDLLSIINDILDVSKIEAGELRLDPRNFVVRDAIEQACASARLDGERKGIAFALLVDETVPARAHGDDRRIRQIVRNLAANAVKFTARGGVEACVRMLAPERPQRLRVEIADTGIGIEPAALARMFEPFTQADATTTRRYGGTGLGLAIVRELVELMGGELGASSEPGAGSTFWFELELAGTE